MGLRILGIDCCIKLARLRPTANVWSLFLGSWLQRWATCTALSMLVVYSLSKLPVAELLAQRPRPQALSKTSTVNCALLQFVSELGSLCLSSLVCILLILSSRLIGAIGVPDKLLDKVVADVGGNHLCVILMDVSSSLLPLLIPIFYN